MTDLLAAMSCTQASLNATLYLNSAGKSLLPDRTKAVGISVISEQDWNRSSIDEVRKLYAQIIHAPHDSISFTASTAFAMTMAARNAVSLGQVKDGSNIILIESDMASAVYPWQYAATETNSQLRVVAHPRLSGYKKTWTETIIEHIDNRTAVICVPCVHWCDGTFIDIVKIREHLDHLHNMDETVSPWLVIDGTQSIGAVPFDVNTIRPTFVACSVHKWLCAPHGMSLIYLDPQYHGSFQPLDLHERARIGSNKVYWDEMGTMDNGYPLPFMSGARKIDGGGHPNPIVVPMLVESLKYLQEIGVESIHSSLRSLTNYLCESIRSDELLNSYLELPDPTSQSANIVGLRVREEKTELTTISLGHRIMEKGAKISIRHKAIRVSPHLHNTRSDIDRFVDITRTCIQEIISSNEVNVLIIGGASWLGQHTYKFLMSQIQENNDKRYNVHITYNRFKPTWVPESNVYQLDFQSSDAKTLMEYLLMKLRPSVIMHLAAMTSPVQCEKMSHDANNVNCPEILVDAIREFSPQAFFLYTSTDLVYNGDQNPEYMIDTQNLAERDLAPVNAYGRTKLAFEHRVLSLPRGIVFRLSNMIGPPSPFVAEPNKAKFLQWIVDNFNKRTFVKLRYDEYRSFVLVEDVARLLSSVVFDKESITRKLFGTDMSSRVFNVGGPKGMSRLELARIVANSYGVQLSVDIDNDNANTEEVWNVGIESNADVVKAMNINNPRCVVMDSNYTELSFGVSLRNLGDVIPTKIREWFS